MARKISISIGIFAHNEEKNIIRILKSIEKQNLETVTIKEILVVSSGSVDKTNRIIKDLSKNNNKIRLLEQFKREGKSSAVNYFLKESKAPILVVASADLRLHTSALEELISPFHNRDVGMVGAHPIPTNLSRNPIGKEIKLMWHLHHLVSLSDPKCGEMIAFRNVVRSIPKESAMDEATIEVLLKMIGFKVIYAPRAIVYNKGPRDIKNFIIQRRRNYAGHLLVKEKYHYQVSTNKSNNLSKALLSEIAKNPQDIFPLFKLIVLEVYSRIMGWIDFNILGRNPYIWTMVER